MIKPAIALCFSLAVPFSVSLADDEQTETLHNNTFQESSELFQCNSTNCSMKFNATQHKNTVISNVNCSVVVPSDTQILYARLYSSSDVNALINTPLSYTGTANGYLYFAINAQVNLFIAQGGIPYFYYLTANGNVSGSICTISGYHS